ncbi:Ribosomal protein S18 acetylase RimI [Sanguibacter gelidistatuariae]|uniref:Ribosomal protein S18 acetylase RimI n=1 Tax=Sanguibacter gelidistatuariae TaxID=1814289 RepID=A0A1G6HL41_9MICO|nr:GNAT family N-acetyltransferase [Sanguibacter gelidistatuariae]SDB94904.1 Ribosomal protein S18 acetylase RimI [Sanguibacter gelidistatuariae]
MTTSTVVVRPAALDDLAGVWPLARDFATSFTVLRPEFTATFEALVGEQRAPDGRALSLLLVAVDPASAAVVGYLLSHTHRSFLANGPLAWIEEVMVSAEHRRYGVGGMLMDAAERWARESGAAYISLASRRAGPFYLALGYEDSATFFKKTL